MLRNGATTERPPWAAERFFENARISFKVIQQRILYPAAWAEALLPERNQKRVAVAEYASAREFRKNVYRTVVASEE